MNMNVSSELALGWYILSVDSLSIGSLMRGITPPYNIQRVFGKNRPATYGLLQSLVLIIIGQRRCFSRDDKNITLSDIPYKYQYIQLSAPVQLKPTSVLELMALMSFRTVTEGTHP